MAATLGAAVGLALYGSFRFAAGTVTRLIQWVYRVRDGRQGRKTS